MGQQQQYKQEVAQAQQQNYGTQQQPQQDGGYSQKFNNQTNGQQGQQQQQLGAGEPAESAQQDGLHKCKQTRHLPSFPFFELHRPTDRPQQCANTFRPVLDRVEKKFGGDRFNNPDNAEKNRKLNDSIIAKLKQVMKVVM